MAAIETYTSSVPDWATQAEYVVHEPSHDGDDLGTFLLESEVQPQFLIAVVSTPNGLCPPSLAASIGLTNPHHQTYHDDSDSPELYTTTDSRLIIIHYPMTGRWGVRGSGGALPYAVTVLAFHPAIQPNSPPSPGPTGGSPFKCRACKMTAKGLALAIVAAATLPTMPAALIAAVSTFIGAGSAFVAGAFIASVIGDTADVIAGKLCKKVGLC